MRMRTILILVIMMLCLAAGSCSAGRDDGGVSVSISSLPDAIVTNTTDEGPAAETTLGEQWPEISGEMESASPSIIPTSLREPLETDFVRVTDYIPTIHVDLKYASPDNFTAQIIYEFTDAYLRYGTVKKLITVQEDLAAQGYSLVIWDAFRPVQAQFKLWEACPDPHYVADPNKGHSSHSKGNTLDVTLVTLDGSAVDMPTGFDDFSEMADRNYGDTEAGAAHNALVLESVMLDNGFSGYKREWWHFTDTTTYAIEESFAP